MKQFKEFGIKPTSKSFAGTKVEMNTILNTEITVHEFRIVNSIFTKDKTNAKCLHLQISIGKIKHVVFTGSGALMDEIQQVPADGFPFITKIIKDNKRFQFT